ncbi:MAG TPA: isochorismatase family cysteine hydrolase [Sedimentisphaerales bacterium]|nr:isochorismatase family cysteine hydrolase [Sedimentisphaerales bacterium]
MIMPLITFGKKRVIVDVDTQEHFFTERGIARVHNHRQVLANILRVVKWAKRKNIRMISTAQVLPSEYSYCNCRLNNFDGQKKISYTLRRSYVSFGAEDNTDLRPDILVRYDQVIFYKRCFDPFEEPRVDRMLSELYADEFVLIGAATEGAVRATALGLLARQKNVTVLVDATGSYNRRAGEITLRLLQERGAKLIKTQTFLSSCCLNLQTSHV